MAEIDDEYIPAPLNPRVRNLPWYTPFAWLRLGLGDMRPTPSGSLFYGLAFIIMGVAVRRLFGYAPEHTMTLVTAFLLAGSFVCLGLYEISRRHESVTRVKLLPTLTAWRANPSGIGMFPSCWPCWWQAGCGFRSSSLPCSSPTICPICR
jgi:uncharacterized membrane protein